MPQAYDLIAPADAGQWRAYHDIRRQVLFEARGQFGVYDDNHPDDSAPGKHPRLLLYGGDPVGVVRIDIEGDVAILRRVAVRADVQRRGHGRMLLSLAQRFAEEAGCTRLASHVAPDAVGFYQRGGFEVDATRMKAPSPHGSVLMTKSLD